MHMGSVRDTFFEEIISGKYDTVLPGNEVVVFEITVDRGKEYKIAPMLCDSFCIMLVTSGVVKLSVNYSTVDLGKKFMVFLTPNMVVSLHNEDNDFKIKGICFVPTFLIICQYMHKSIIR